MHGRRSIIKRRDDDDITMTRPLNKRVSFSANNHTRLFQVDSDESSRHTNLDSTGQQSMEQTIAHSVTLEFYKSSLTAPMETTGLANQTDDTEDTGFDWTDENMEVDLNAPTHETPSNNESMDTDKDQIPGTSTRSSLEVDDKTRPVELRTEQTANVKDEILRVASRLLKPEHSNGETTSASIDLYGIKAALNSQTARQQRPNQKSEVNPCVQPGAGQSVRFQNIFDVTNVERHSRQISFSSSALQISSDRCPEPMRVLEETGAEHFEEADVDEDDDATMSELSNKSCSINESEAEDEVSLNEESQSLNSRDSNQFPSESWFNVTGVNNLDQDESSPKASQPANPLEFSSTYDLATSVDLTQQSEGNSAEMEPETFQSSNLVASVDYSSLAGKSCSVNQTVEDDLPKSFDSSTAKHLSVTAISHTSKILKTNETSASNETYSVYNTTQATVDADVSNVADEPELSFLSTSFASTPPNKSPYLDRTKRISGTNAWNLDDWVKYDQDLFSVFKEPIPELPPVPEPMPVEHNLRLDEERLQNALKLDPDPEFEEFIKREKRVTQEINEQCVTLIKSLELALKEQNTVLIDDAPFYNHLSPEKFKIISHVRSKSVKVCYRISLIPCVLIECKEKKNGSVEISAKVIDSVPDVVCPFLSYAKSWIKNAFGGSSNFTTQTWLKAQSKVLSALEVIDTHFEAFQSVLYRLHWCEEKQQVYLNLGWRSRLVRVYIDADLQEELVPQEDDTIELRDSDLSSAWKSDRFLSFRERINNVHRRNLEIAAEEWLKSVTF